MIQERSRGSIVLFAAVILLPLVFLLLTLSLDITQLYANRNAAQQLIDEAALHGYRFLPFQQQAKAAVEGYLKDLNLVQGGIKSRVTSDQIEIIYHGVAPFTFASSAGDRGGIPYELRSRVRGSLIHGVIMIDNGAECAPVDSAHLWGSTYEWPEAALFSSYLPFATDVSPRLATQQCFNPLFSRLKGVALRLFDYLSSFSRNSIGVTFFPGTLSQIDIIRDSRGSGELPDDISLGYFNIANSRLARNSYCLSLVERESPESRYRIPSFGGFRSDSRENSEPLTDPDSHVVLESALSNIRTRDIIWSRAVRPVQRPTIRYLLSSLTALLSSGGSLNLQERNDHIADRPVKVGILLATTLPSDGEAVFPATEVQNALRDELHRFWLMIGGNSEGKSDSSSNVTVGRLYYVFFPREEREAELNSMRDLQLFFNQVIQDFGAEQRLTVRVVYSSDEIGVSQGVIQSLLLENNTAVIDE